MLFIIHNKLLLLSADIGRIKKVVTADQDKKKIKTNPKETNKKFIYREFKINACPRTSAFKSLVLLTNFYSGFREIVKERERRRTVKLNLELRTVNILLI